MSTKNIDITKLEDLDKLRSAPNLNKKQSKTLFNQLSHLINKSDWITIGVMSPSFKRKRIVIIKNTNNSIKDVL